MPYEPLSHVRLHDQRRCEIHYMEWSAQNKPVVIAWHGLARTSRDMDELAEHLSSPTIGGYAGNPSAFATVSELERYLRRSTSPTDF